MTIFIPQNREAEIRKEECKLERLRKAKAPEVSIRWVLQRIKYLKSGKQIGHDRRLVARINPATIFREGECHELALSIYNELTLSKEESSYEVKLEEILPKLRIATDVVVTAQIAEDSSDDVKSPLPSLTVVLGFEKPCTNRDLRNKVFDPGKSLN